MSEKIKVPAGLPSKVEIEIKKSKFIGCCFHASNDKEARQIIASVKSEHKLARHVVYAFICGKPGSQNMGMSDDGEPKGTAGKPVLQVLKGSGTTDILCTVVRYFGGIKLGTGGLVRAYTEAAKASLEKLETKYLVSETEITVTVDFSGYDNVRHIITSTEGIAITGEEFLTAVTIKALIPDELLDSVTDAIIDSTSGRAVINVIKTNSAI